jgi:indolepyruvate ferredoxin oxidoreductase, alpha subunit
MAERAFAKEVGHPGLGTGEEFRGEGILAITKALPQSGVGYVGGYQGAPILQPRDALADAQDILAELGVRFTASALAAAAVLSASLMCPIRGTAAFKSTVGTDVAADALARLASGGVAGGAVIIEALQGAQVRA